MLRPVGVALVIWSAAALAAPNAAPGSSEARGPSGRVVRVVRSGGASHAPPRLCKIRGDGGTCVGGEPRRGETVTVLDDHRVIAEVQILEAKLYSAGCPSLWTVKTRALHGVNPDGDGIGVIDASLNPSRAHALDKSHWPPSPNGQPGEDVWIDRDGDGVADMLITRYSCDASGKPSGGTPTSCIDIWERRGTVTMQGGQSAQKLTRTSQLNFAQCNI